LPISESSQQARLAGATVFAVAFALRLLPVFVFPSIHYPDEIFQTLEPAHRLVFGTGLLSWEWIYGMRSWLLPGFLAGLMEASRPFGGGPGAYMPMIGTALAALGASSALCAFLWGKRLYGLWGGVIAGAFVAAWIDAVYFGPRTLSEAVAAHVLVIGLYLLAPGGRTAAGKRRLAGAGFVLALAALIRIQLAPAVAFLALWPWAEMAPFKRRLLPLILGGGVALLLYGALDAATWGYPFESLWRDLYINLWLGVSRHWGSQPWSWYIGTLFSYWNGLAVLLLVLARIGALDFLQPALGALVIFVVHSAVGHKEWRFIYPAVLLAIVSAGLGLARLTEWLADGLALRGYARGDALRLAGVPVLVVAVLGSAGLAASPDYRALWSRDADVVRASMAVANLEGVCGIALYGIDWWNSGGYTLMNQNVPLYWVDAAGLAAQSNAFDTVVAAKALPDNSPYRTTTCFHSVCVAQRTGGCAAAPMTPLGIPPGLEGVKPAVRR
jgi:GPI mannosyltransferase 3